jgi:hypothetical protein
MNGSGMPPPHAPAHGGQPYPPPSSFPLKSRKSSNFTIKNIGHIIGVILLAFAMFSLGFGFCSYFLGPHFATLRVSRKSYLKDLSRKVDDLHQRTQQNRPSHMSRRKEEDLIDEQWKEDSYRSRLEAEKEVLSTLSRLYEHGLM